MSREWWVQVSMAKLSNITSESIWDAYTKGPPNPEAIHVIEKAAYDELKTENIRLRISHDAAIAVLYKHSTQWGQKFGAMDREAGKLASALHKIASWEEGAEVHSGFDNPTDAKIAREALINWNDYWENNKEEKRT